MHTVPERMHERLHVSTWYVFNVYENVTVAANQSITAFKWTVRFTRIVSEYVSSQKRH